VNDETKDYSCTACERIQTSLSEEAAELIGWRKIASKWECPFCTGNTGILEKLFENLEDADEVFGDDDEEDEDTRDDIENA